MNRSFSSSRCFPSIALAILTAAIGCSHNTKQAIIYASSARPNVRNGTAFDRGALPLEGVTTCVVPTTATVEHREDANELILLLKKELNYVGIPPERYTIDEAREKMGVAYKREGDKLTIASYGDFSCGEGGKNVVLQIIAPVGLNIERLDPSLEMPLEIPGAGAAVLSPLRRQESGDAQWCELKGSPDRWTIVDTSPDVASMQEALLAQKSQDDD